jgi:superfamily II DNA or RNA helicase
MTRQEVQQAAIQSWVDHNFRSTLFLATGVGKTITSFLCLYKALELGVLPKKARVLILAETTVRKQTIFEDEIPKFKKLFGKNLEKDFEIIFRTYQAIRTSPNPEHDILIADEIDFACSAFYMEALKTDQPMIGLTATVNNSPVFEQDEEQVFVPQSAEEVEAGIIGPFITKSQLLQILCPISIRYTREQAIEDGVLSPYKVIVLKHNLDENVAAMMHVKDKYKTTEKAWYEDKLRFMRVAPAYLKIQIGRNQLPPFLYNLPSKTSLVKNLNERILKLGMKTLIIGVQKESLYKITEHVLDKDNSLIDKFNRGEINTLASANKLGRGITLENISVVIYQSFNSSVTKFEQVNGRVLRFQEGKTGYIIIPVTESTLEKKWFTNANKNTHGKGANFRVDYTANSVEEIIEILSGARD